MQSIVDEIRHRFGTLCVRTQRSDLALVEVDAEKVVGLLTWMRRSTSYTQLTHMSAVDWIEDGEFQISYLVTDPDAHLTVIVCCRIDREGEDAESIHALWPEAVTYEQELNEMYGIRFPGSPRQGVDFLLEGWDGPPPMRRDFDTLKFAEERYGFRPGREHIDPKEVRAEFMARERARKEAEKAKEGGAT